VDYAVPLRWNLPGLVARLAELAAGPRHFGAFRSYLRQGGLKTLSAAAALPLTHRETLEGGALAMFG
jgi:hypothetical protein